jgi:hypothetical protein
MTGIGWLRPAIFILLLSCIYLTSEMLRLARKAVTTEQSFVLIFISTHFSPEHIQFLHHCWPKIRARSSLVRSADIVVFSTGCGYSEKLRLLRRVFPTQKVTLFEYTNPGYQRGAMLAIEKALQSGWFQGYKWIVRLNPDVVIRNDSWILKTMTDPDVDGIFIDCLDTACPEKRSCLAAHIHTDFFAVRPEAISATQASLHSSTAEIQTTAMFRPIVARGRDRWLPNNKQHGICRVRGPHSPVVHDHSFLLACIRTP